MMEEPYRNSKKKHKKNITKNYIILSLLIMVGQQGKFFISKAFKKFDSIFITLRIHNFQNNMKEKHKKVVNG